MKRKYEGFWWKVFTILTKEKETLGRSTTSASPYNAGGRKLYTMSKKKK
jgi:hypothetical protein